jgi:hypothetical protein
LKAEIGKIYKHYKGGLYIVVGISCHTETKETLVIYKDLKIEGLDKTWARPIEMFEEILEIDDKKVHRFKKHKFTKQ